MVSFSDAAQCISTVDCPMNMSVCILNCSKVAVEQLNQPASQGNCRAIASDGGTLMQSCFFDECPTSSPEYCVPLRVEGHPVTECCCTVDYCNSQFQNPPNVTDENKNETAESVINATRHIYKTFPNHTTEGIEYHMVGNFQRKYF